MASAPSLHMIRADIQTEVNPFAGSQSQSEELAASLKQKMADGGDAIWETEIFGKTLSDLVREGVNGKLSHLPEEARQKLRQALEKVINEGSGGMICIML
jgi:stage IV sporulation protein A